jgi:hypothetical protein
VPAVFDLSLLLNCFQTAGTTQPRTLCSYVRAQLLLQGMSLPVRQTIEALVVNVYAAVYLRASDTI